MVQVKTINPDLAMPEDLSPLGVKTYKAITAFLKKKETDYTGGCKAFYSPREWVERGEDYGVNAVLIVVHDGGDLAPIFNYSYERYALMEEMVACLDKVGVFAEQCTNWYTAIYKC